jgi:DNA-binding transcriptional LysR family regulator
VDLAVLTQPRLPSTIHFHKLFEERLLIAVSPQNPVAAGCEPGRRENGDYPYLEPGRLKDQSFILSRQHMRLRESADEFFHMQRIEPNIAVTVASSQSANRLAAYGVGVAFLPERFVRELAQPPYPVYFRTDDTLKSWVVGVACDDRRENHLAKQFIRIFEDVICSSRSFSKK